MATEIEIALVGPHARPFRTVIPEWPLLWDEEMRKSWDDRPKLSLSVEDTDSLATIFDQAAEAFGSWESPHGPPDGFGTDRFIALRLDSSPLPLEERLTRSPAIIEADGRATWFVRDFATVSYADLRESARVGALPGDPTQLYFHVRLTPAGGALLPQWSLIVQAFTIAGVALGTAAAINETHDLYVKIRRYLEGRRTIEERMQEWIERRGWPDQLERMLRGEQDWKPRDLAGALGCTTSEAENILGLYGYVPGPSSAWIYAGGNKALGIEATDPAARVLVAYRREALARYPDKPGGSEDDLRALFVQIVTEVVETRDVTALAYEEYEDKRKKERERHLEEARREVQGDSQDAQ